MHSAMANCVRVKQVASEASRVSSASGRSGRNFFFPDASKRRAAVPQGPVGKITNGERKGRTKRTPRAASGERRRTSPTRTEWDPNQTNAPGGEEKTTGLLGMNQLKESRRRNRRSTGKGEMTAGGAEEVDTEPTNASPSAQ